MIPLSTKTSANALISTMNGIGLFNHLFRISESLKVTTTLFVTVINANLLDQNLFQQAYAPTPNKRIWVLLDGGKFQVILARVV